MDYKDQRIYFIDFRPGHNNRKVPVYRNGEKIPLSLNKDHHDICRSILSDYLEWERFYGKLDMVDIYLEDFKDKLGVYFNEIDPPWKICGITIRELIQKSENEKEAKNG